MKEFQNIPGSAVFMDIERLLIRETEELWKARHDISTDRLDVQHEQHTVVFIRNIAPLPFLKFKRLAIKIFPPYNYTDVHIFDRKSSEFGSRLKEQLGLYWEYGREYQHPGNEEKEEEEYFKSLLLNDIVAIKTGEFIPETPEEIYHATLERFTQEQKAFAEARN